MLAFISFNASDRKAKSHCMYPVGRIAKLKDIPNSVSSAAMTNSASETQRRGSYLQGLAN